MNVTVENLAPCKKLLRVEVDAAAVDDAFKSVTADFQRHAQLPGFRPGKAPRAMVEQTYGKKIEEEVRRKLIPDAYRQALTENNLRTVTYPDIEEIQFGRGQPLQFAATVEIEPEFELPDYKGLPAKIETRTVTDADLQRALDALRQQHAQFNDLSRPVQAGDFVVVNYTGTCEGKPITELAPAARGVAEQKNFWIEVRPDSFIPGFADQLIGAQAGDKRTVTVDFKEDFVTQELARKQGVYEVEVLQVKERVLPEVTDEFAQRYGAENVEKLREGIRNDLENELKFQRKRQVRDQLAQALLARVTCELPDSVVMAETRNVVYDIVRDSQQRGVSKDLIDQQKDQIFSMANTSAKDRVKASFLLRRIAENEGIKVQQEEVANRVLQLAQQYRVEPQKMVKELQQRNGFAEIEEQILTSKVLDFLELNAQVEEVPAAPAAPNAP